MSHMLSGRILFIMGVSGSGKTTVGRLLAKELSIPFIDADDHHPQSNIKKMSQGIPLNDSDRKPWLDKLHEIAVNHLCTGCVIACSALKEDYRNRLTRSITKNTAWIFLKGNYNQIYERMQSREGHFMDAKLLKSQFETLEEPENAILLNIGERPDILVQELLERIK